MYVFWNAGLNNRLDRQCMYNVTWRRVRATIVAVEKQWMLHILSISSLRYPACNEHAPYCHRWHFRLCSIFPHYLINGMTFEKQLLNKKCFFILSTTFVWNIFHSKKNWARCDKKFILVFITSSKTQRRAFRNILTINVTYITEFVSYCINWDAVFLGAFAKLRKTTISFVMSVHLSVRPHWITRLPLCGFSWNLVCESF